MSDTPIMTEDVFPKRSDAETATLAPQPYPLGRSIALHLAPGAIFTVFLVLVVPVVTSWGIDPIFAFFGGIGAVLVPIELGYLVVYARRATGSWSPLRAVDYRERLRGGRLALLTVGLTAWFLLGLVVSIAFLDERLATGIFSWMPDALLQFAIVEEGEPPTSGALVAFVLIAFVCNGVLGPITEELYFRGHLLPRLAPYGRWAPVINTVLFGIYHFFMPWRYPAIILGFLPITWMAWRERSVYVSIAAHVTINMITVLLILGAVLAAGN
ncbi:MAG TPA: CPBP family intramembrane glutamic endopeptidase [Euzebyales bacterium]|nr:CPBP family intramembrane glutamic endopeptidase [Euzebyales bacterium]